MILDDIISAQKAGEARGIVSICSAQPWVIKAAMLHAAHTGETLLIEATCNQVNQFGGYTGMTPADFALFVHRLAYENGLNEQKLLLGGDHLGPNVWQNEPADTAMEKSAVMVSAYVQAGFSKIHLDASMKLGGDDPARPLDMEVAGQRAGYLAGVAEKSCAAGCTAPLHYVIGTEVPVPGGATAHEDGVVVTSPHDVRQTIDIIQAAFNRQGLGEAWERTVAVVVQPGVEFGDDFVLDYQPEKAHDLAAFIASEPHLVYEAHSTDYQMRESLRNLVRDHFSILKVGPGLTFAFREAIFALAMIENELLSEEYRSNLLPVLDEAMIRQPGYWEKYYPGTAQEQAIKRKFSLSDRVRYYWPDAQVQTALTRLLANLDQTALPLSLLSQYAARFYEGVRQGERVNKPVSLLIGWIEDVLEDYAFACNP